MDPFLIKKLGEAFAFTRAFRDTLQKGKKGFLKIIEKKEFENLLSKNEAHIGSIMKIVAEHDIDDEVRERAARMEEKLNKMRGVFLPREKNFSDPLDVSEWMGFFEGAAYLHWIVVRDEAEKKKTGDLQVLANKAADFHETVLEQIASYIKRI